MVKTLLVTTALISSVALAQAPAKKAPSTNKKGTFQGSLATPPEDDSKTSSNAVHLSPKDVAELVLKQSYRAQEVNLTAEQIRLVLAQVEQRYDFQLKADAGYLTSKFESTTNPYLLKDENYTTDLSLAKSFFTGTTLGLFYNRLSDRPDVSSAAPTPQNPYTMDTIGLTLNQNLLKNFFGYQDRADLNSAEDTVHASRIDRVSNLQNLVLSAISSYWTAYVSEQNFQEALNSRNRYQKLVGTVQKKTNYGYSNPGDLAQAQAELEVREQNVKSLSAEYLANLDSLITLLRLPAKSEIKFVVSEDIPTPPKTPETDLEALRPIKSSKLKLSSAQEALKSASNNTLPDLSLVGKVYYQGLDEKADDSYSEMVSGSHPQYYVGVQLNYNFGSGYLTENELNKRVTRDLADIQLARQRLELKDQEENLIRQIQSTYTIAVSKRTERSLREKAALQLSQTYNQGRTDITILIQALNNYFDSEVQFSRAIGDYQIALNQWAAFRDELIPRVKED